MKISELYDKVIRKLADKTFFFWQMLGIHVRPVHFYEPIPDTRKLKKDLWGKKSKLPGININEGGQIELLRSFISKFKKEYEEIPKSKTKADHQYYRDNDEYASPDGEILWCMIRHFKPKNMIEIGSGNSTYLSAETLLKNKKEHGINSVLVAIEPYPNETLRKGFPGLSKLITSGVQEVSLQEFEKLKENDILFIDSSHVLKIGSDVQYEYLEILPRLNKGVIVHIHDIFLPAEYPKEWVMKEHRFWNEQYLLQAFLAFNKNFEVLWAGSYMHLLHKDLLKNAFDFYNPDTTWPASFWIRRI